MTFTVEVADAARLAAVLSNGRTRQRRAFGAAPLNAPESAPAAAIISGFRRRVAQLVRAPP